MTPTTMIRPLLHARRIVPARPGRPRKLIQVSTSGSSLKLFFDRGRAAYSLRFRRRKLAQDGFHLEGFDNVAGFHVVEILQRDTAFVTLRDFARVVLEALQRRELAFPYRAPVADQARTRTADNLAV